MAATLDDVNDELKQIRLLINDYIYGKKNVKSYVLSGAQKIVTSSASAVPSGSPIFLNDKYYTDLDIWVSPASTLTHDSTITITTATEAGQAPLTVNVGLAFKRIKLSGIRINQIAISNPDYATINVTYYVSYIQYREPSSPTLELRNA